jgi:hypothetical protein
MDNPMQGGRRLFGVCRRVAGAALAFAILLGLTAVATTSVRAQTFTTIDVTGAGTGLYQGTAITAMNVSGEVAGVYLDANGALHGFVLPAGGQIATFDAGAATGAHQGTIPVGINASGTITGSYIDGNSASHGFVRTANGQITTFDAPLAPTATASRGTSAMSINDSGVIVGFYTTGSVGTGAYYGFQRAAKSPYTITAVNDPNAGSDIGPNGTKQGTSAYGINASGEIVGGYKDSNSVQHGFVLVGSTYTTVDVADTGTCATDHGNPYGGTTPWSIDAAGDLAGSYYDTSCAQHGFWYTASNKKITTFDAPGADTSPCPNSGPAHTVCGTLYASFDAAGNMTGGYADSAGTVHGFLRPSATGTVISFDDPDAGTLPYQGTIGFRIRVNATGITIAGAYADSTYNVHGFIYTPALTTTKLTSSPNPSTDGQTVPFTAVVTPAPPNGETVSFMQGTTVLGTGTLSGGSATFKTSTLKVGTDSITAVYAGDLNFAASTSKADKQVVGKATTTTKLVSSQNPSSYEQSVTFTATVTPEFSGTTPTGSVTFYNGTATLGTVTLRSGVAGYTTTKQAVGTGSITAQYKGSGSFDTSTSAALSQVVNPASTTTTLASSLNPSKSGQSVTFTATVVGKFGGTVTGSVTFTDGTATLGTVILSGGKAKYTTSTLAVGTHNITATYTHSTDYTGSSTSLTQTVN